MWFETSSAAHDATGMFRLHDKFESGLGGLRKTIKQADTRVLNDDEEAFKIQRQNHPPSKKLHQQCIQWQGLEAGEPQSEDMEDGLLQQLDREAGVVGDKARVLQFSASSGAPTRQDLSRNTNCNLRLHLSSQRHIILEEQCHVLQSILHCAAGSAGFQLLSSLNNSI